MYEIKQTSIFNKWYSKQELTVRIIIDARFKRVKELGGLGSVRCLGSKLFEFKWNVGIRIYFIIKDDKRVIILLNGGNKNGQKRDIQKARKLQKDYGV